MPRLLRRAVRLAGLVALLLLSAMVSSASTDMGSDKQRADGKQLYDKYCAQCHGISGDGIGYATYRVKPQPRDFTVGKYKFRTTPSGMLPTDADIAKVIREGLPYTSMPGWPQFNESQIQNLVYYLKTFSPDFANPDKHGQPLTIPAPPASSDESVANGRQVYELQGCAACHGELGRSDGLSAPTLSDDWGNHIRAADLTQRWTFRGGPTKRDIFRTFSTGLNGTPMPSYADSLAESDRWDLVNYIYSLGDGDEPNYAELLQVAYTDQELDLAAADELFAEAPMARFPLVGQVIEPGRNFYPSVTSIEVEAVYNRQEIVFRLRWNDMRADTTGSNDPAQPVPQWDEDNPIQEAADEGEDEGGFWGVEEVADEAPSDEDLWGVEVADEDAGDDFWGEEDDTAAAAGGEFSDAVALQFPSQMPGGIRKPYFIFGDLQNSVDLWFVDLARGEVQQYVGRGSQSLEAAEADDFETVAEFDQGRWTVLIKRSLDASGGISLDEEMFVPMALSVWDGFNRERGNKRALSAWFYLYTRPQQQIELAGPMMRAGLIALVVELLIVGLIWRRFRGRRAAGAGSPLPEAG